MINTIITICVSIFFLYSGTPKIGVKEIEKSLNVLYEKNILHQYFDTLYIELENITVDYDSLRTINVNDKQVYINFHKKEIPFLFFHTQTSKKDINRHYIEFEIEVGGGYEYTGYFTFDYSNDNFVYKDCNYVKGIE